MILHTFFFILFFVSYFRHLYQSTRDTTLFDKSYAMYFSEIFTVYQCIFFFNIRLFLFIVYRFYHYFLLLHRHQAKSSEWREIFFMPKCRIIIYWHFVHVRLGRCCCIPCEYIKCHQYVPVYINLVLSLLYCTIWNCTVLSLDYFNEFFYSYNESLHAYKTQSNYYLFLWKF